MQFLGDERIRDKGLVCNYVIAKFPSNTPTSERAVPTAIFSTDPSVARTYLRKWCGSDVGRHGDMNAVPDVRDIVDWDYYRERLGNAIQKIITIPAAMQRVPNPVPRVRHPDWLHRKVQEKEDTHKQAKLDTMFAAAATKKTAAGGIGDLEDMGARPKPGAAGAAPIVGIVSSVDITPGTAKRQAADSSGSKENNPGSAQQQQQPPPPTPEVQMVDRHESFTGWLAFKKMQWRKKRLDRKRQREALGPDALAAGRRLRQRGGPVIGVDNLFQQQAEAATGMFWQIVSITATKEPGVFKAWTVINGRMHAIPLRVPREVYIDTNLPPTDPKTNTFGPVR